MTPLASRSTNSPNKRPMAILKCKMHKKTQARGNCKNPLHTTTIKLVKQASQG